MEQQIKSESSQNSMISVCNLFKLLQNRVFSQKLSRLKFDDGPVCKFFIISSFSLCSLSCTHCHITAIWMSFQPHQLVLKLTASWVRQRFSTGVRYECLKHAIPDYLVKSGALTSFLLDCQVKCDNNQHNNSHPV